MTKFIEQRVDELENQVAKLELIIHELRGKKSIEPSTTNTVEDIIEFEGAKYRKVNREARKGDVVIFRNQINNHIPKNNTPYLMDEDEFIETDTNECFVYSEIHNRTLETVDVYELIKSQPLTPNQQRVAIIEKAKQFVEENQDDYFHVEVDDEKRTVFTWKLITEGEIYKAMTGLASCHSDDVFNEHIGKAIALGRALGLDVSEFEQAVQPTEFVTGQIITFESDLAGEDKGAKFKIKSIEDSTLWLDDNYDGYDLCDEDWKPKIINDTNAKYEEGQ